MHIVYLIIVLILSNIMSCIGQEMVKVTISFSCMTSINLDSSENKEFGLLIEIKNISNEQVVLLHKEPLRNYLIPGQRKAVTIVNNTAKDSLSTNLISVKYNDINYSNLLTNIAKDNPPNQRPLVEIKYDELVDIGLSGEDFKSQPIFAILLQPGELYYDFKRLYRELKNPNKYSFKFEPMLFNYKKKINYLMIDKSLYRVALPNEYISNTVQLIRLKN